MIVKNSKVVSRLLYCQVCEVWTNHVAKTDGFVCSCGEEVISVNRTQRNDAVRLAIANEAEQELLKGYEDGNQKRLRTHRPPQRSSRTRGEDSGVGNRD